MIKKLGVCIGVAALAGSTLLAPAAALPAHAGVSLVGGGSSFDLPFFQRAFEVYGKKYGVSVNYQPVGSGAGIQAFIAKTVDFGATDVPMDPTSELQQAVKAGGPVDQIPITLGGVSIAYTLPGVKTGLHLTGPVLADIYLGLITKWNDPQIRKLNRGVHLPSTAITVVHRSDGSGTSYIFTDYLSKISDTWRGKAGTSKLPNWPAGVGGKGNPGVAQIVQSTPGAIGYVELAFVLENHMKQAAMQNRSHQFTVPNQKSIASAAAAFPHVSARSFSIVNASGKASYPIAGYSWVLVYQHPADHAKAKATAKLMGWMLTTGQTYAKKLNYVALPKQVRLIGQTLLKHVS